MLESLRLFAREVANMNLARCIEPTYPVSASLCTGELTLPRLRFICRPDVLGFQATEAVA